LILVLWLCGISGLIAVMVRRIRAGEDVPHWF